MSTAYIRRKKIKENLVTPMIFSTEKINNYNHNRDSPLSLAIEPCVETLALATWTVTC